MVSCTTRILPTLADWTDSGTCTSGSIGPRSDGMKANSGCTATMSTKRVLMMPRHVVIRPILARKYLPLEPLSIRKGSSMNNSSCCTKTENAASRWSWFHAAGRVASWIVPGAVLAAMPKCPLCLAVYVALFTGCGISLVAASVTWWFMVGGCIGVLVYLTIRAVCSLTLKVRL